MTSVTLKYQGKVLGTYALEQGKSLTIGRRESNDVVIENLVVSGNHAKIDYLDEGFLLTDLRSKNGTFVNNELITSHWLKAGDVITIGKHTLAFNISEEAGFDFESEEDMGKTMVLNTEDHPSKANQSSPAVLSFLKGGQGEFPLTKKLTKIGKDFSNDIVVSGFTVGQTSATVSKLPEGFYINYVGGMAKPKINGKTISSSQRLEEFDIIEIGSAKMEFILK